MANPIDQYTDNLIPRDVEGTKRLGCVLRKASTNYHVRVSQYDWFEEFMNILGRIRIIPVNQHVEFRVDTVKHTLNCKTFSLSAFLQYYSSVLLSYFARRIG